MSKNDHILRIDQITINHDELKIDGLFQTPLPQNDWELSLSFGEQRFHLNPNSIKIKVPSISNETLNNAYYFKQKIELTGLKRGQFILNTGDTNFRLNIHFIKEQESQFLCRKNKIFLFKTKCFYILNNSFKNRLKLNLIYFLRLIKEKKYKVLIFRLTYLLLKFFKRKEIWIISDRLNSGGDNGEVFFEYATKQNDNVKKFFLINKISPDRNRIKKFGKVRDFHTIRYKLIFLLADKIISSQISDEIINAFGNYRKYYYDLYNFDLIFLQHGVIKDDMSNYLHKLGKNIRLFITSAKPEYRSILTNDYLYSEKEIILTGLPRFDKLENNTKKEILIMPTWRSTLALPRDRYGLRKKNPAFIESKYYKFYNSLIHHPKLIKYAQKFGYKIILHLHPEFIQYADEFYGNSITKVDKKICNYSKAFSHGCLLVTDYSSTVFDFVYLRKPVIYTQFDKEDIFNTHTYKKGYFDYKDDGFGPVCKDLDSTIDTIIKILENDCKLEDKYRRRIDNFFEYDDKNNCERVYKSIKELD